jgi:copper chaperone NosL
MKKIWVWIWILCLMLLISACGEQVKPRAIDEKTDICDVCNMSVMDNQFATQAVLENKKVLTFDDIGCMHKWEKENKKQQIKETFVRDYKSKDWITSDKATYVFGKSIKTPMAYNVISFKDKEDATSYAKKHSAQVMNYDKLLSHQWKMNKKMMDMNKGEQDHMHDKNGEMKNHMEKK